GRCRTRDRGAGCAADPDGPRSPPGRERAELRARRTRRARARPRLSSPDAGTSGRGETYGSWRKERRSNARGSQSLTWTAHSGARPGRADIDLARRVRIGLVADTSAA